MWYDIFGNWWFWVLFGLLAYMGVFRRINILRRLPILNNRRHALIVAVIGVVLTTGWLGSVWTGSLTPAGQLSDIQISQIHTTTAYVVGNTTATSIVTDSGIDDTKMSDFYVTEGQVNGNAFVELGVFQVIRSGNLDADSCQVEVIKPPRYDIDDTTYKLVNEDSNTGIMDAYVYTGSSSAAANGDEPKEKNMLFFDEGVAVGYVAFNISLDETGIDPLTQYDYKDIHVDICGYPYTFRVHKSDA